MKSRGYSIITVAPFFVFELWEHCREQRRSPMGLIFKRNSLTVPAQFLPVVLVDRFDRKEPGLLNAADPFHHGRIPLVDSWMRYLNAVPPLCGLSVFQPKNAGNDVALQGQGSWGSGPEISNTHDFESGRLVNYGLSTVCPIFLYIFL